VAAERYNLAMGDRSTAVRAMIGLGQIHLIRNNVSRALARFDEALNGIQEHPTAENRRREREALGLRAQARLRSASELDIAAHKLGTDPSCDSATERYAAADSMYRAAAEDLIACNGLTQSFERLRSANQNYLLGLAFLGVGNCASARDDYTESVKFFEKALQCMTGIVRENANAGDHKLAELAGLARKQIAVIQQHLDADRPKAH
jgi:tetratricopeptide (TPR) repeat protein